MVHFVGAGPGAVDLITVRGRQLIEQADVIIYAGSLVNPELLQYAKADCEIHDSARMTLDEVIAVMCKAENRRRVTVRLHTGDPSLYGAVREQMDRLAAQGIAYDVCPGVTAAFGAAASLACEYTLPSVTQTLILTRAEGKTPVPERERLRSLAAHGASLVLYLSAGLAEPVQQELLAGGYSGETPVAVVYKATWADERIVRTDVKGFPEAMQAAQIDKTALIIVSMALAGSYERSRLYDASFSTEYRTAREICLPHGIRRILMIACSVQGYETMTRMADMLKNAGADVVSKVRCEALSEVSMRETVHACTARYFDQVDAIVFVSACGIAVRSIADSLKHKAKDPAVVCMDELGKHVIPLVSGHIGGANALARMLADVMHSTAVITTATDMEGSFSIDDYAREHNMAVTDWAKAKAISTQVLRNGCAPVWSDSEESAETDGKLRVLCSIGDYRVLISPYRIDVTDRELQLVPHCIVAGIGCKKQTSESYIAAAVQDALEKANLRPESLCALATIDLKKEEPGLLAYCKKHDLEFAIYTAGELAWVSGEFSTSEFVEQVTGVDNVCERSAARYAADKKIFGNGQINKLYKDQVFVGETADAGDSPCRLLLRKQAANGVTVALALIERNDQPWNTNLKRTDNYISSESAPARGRG